MSALLLPTQFGLCIDELVEVVSKFVKEENIEEVTIGNVFIALLLYTNTLEDTQKLMRALEAFCMHIVLSLNGSKINIMLLSSQNNDRTYIICL